jgi:hypothetical protein
MCKYTETLLTGVASNLVLRDDDLAGEGVFRVWNRMAENADAPYYLSSFVHFVCKVARIPNDTVSASNLALMYNYVTSSGNSSLKLFYCVLGLYCKWTFLLFAEVKWG